MPGLNDPNDSAFTDPSQNGGWRWNAQKGSWEPTDPVVGALWNLPDQLGLRAQSIKAGTPGADVNLGMAGDDRARMGGLLAQLGTQAMTGGGAWEQALKQNTATANNTAMALGQSLGGDAMSSSRAIGNARAGNEQRAVGQGNLLRAQTQQQAQGQLADIFAGQGALDAEGASAQAGARQGLLQANRSLESGAAAARRNLVGGAGQAAMSAFSDGGEVPGTPKVFGDDQRNDTVPAWLSPDEIVIPISITSRPDAPEAAAAFVAAVKGRGTPGQSHFDVGGEVDTGTDVLPTGGNATPYSVHSVAPGSMPTASQLDPFASQQLDASVANGGKLDTNPYRQTRSANLANAGHFMEQSLGRGPSVAPQAFQNATDTTINDAMRARGPVGDVVGAASAQEQGAAGNAAGLVAGESQRGAQAFAEAVHKQRAQDLALATAEQQAAWRNAMMNAGVGLEQQAQLRGLLGGAGQGAVAMGGMFDTGPDKSYHYDSGGGRYDTTPAYEAPTSSSPGEWAQPFADGGVVAHLARKSERKNPRTEIGGWKPEQGTPDEWKPFPEKKTARSGSTQTEDDIQLNYASGGQVFDPIFGAPVPPQPNFNVDDVIMGATKSIPDALRALAMAQPASQDATLTPEQAAYRASLQVPGVTEPMRPHNPTSAERPFIAKPMAPPQAPVAALVAPPMAPAAPAQKAAPAAPKSDPYAEQQKALGMKAEAEAQQADANAATLGNLQKSLEQNAIQQKELQARASESAERQLLAIQQARDELKNINTNVDTGHYWADKGVPGKIAAVIGLALGAIGNDNGVNRSAQLLNQAIDRDIDAQKASFELALRKGQSAVDSAQSIYALSRQHTQDDIAANLAAKGTALDLAKNQVDLAAAKAGAPMAKANLAALSAQLGIDKQKADDALKQRGFDNSIKKQQADADTMRAQADAAAVGAKGAPAFVAPGYTLSPGAKPKPDELEKWRAARAGADDVKAKATQLRDMISKGELDGRDRFRGENRAKAEALIGSLKVAAKEAFTLGAISGPDMELLMSQISDPTGMSGLVTANKTMTSKLNQFIANADQTVSKKADSLGIVKDDQFAEARAWLAANPNHPDAAAVRAKIEGR